MMPTATGLDFPQGDTKLSMYSVEDTGPLVLIIQSSRTIHRTTSGCCRRRQELCSICCCNDRKCLGIQFTTAIFLAKLMLPGMAGSGRSGPCSSAAFDIPERWLHLIESYGLHPAMQSFEQWLTKHKSSLSCPYQSAISSFGIVTKRDKR